jgi:hypothetical protein
VEALYAAIMQPLTGFLFTPKKACEWPGKSSLSQQRSREVAQNCLWNLIYWKCESPADLGHLTGRAALDLWLSWRLRIRGCGRFYQAWILHKAGEAASGSHGSPSTKQLMPMQDLILGSGSYPFTARMTDPTLLLTVLNNPTAHA